MIVAVLHAQVREVRHLNTNHIHVAVVLLQAVALHHTAVRHQEQVVVHPAHTAVAEEVAAVAVAEEVEVQVEVDVDRLKKYREVVYIIH